MSMGKQPGSTTQTSKVELPPWVNQASQDNYNLALQVANQDQSPYYDPTKRYVGPGAETTGADAYYRANMNSSDPMYAQALAGIQGLMGYNADNISGTSYQADTLKDRLAAGDLSNYLNPYLSNVESGALGALDKQRTAALQQNASKATAAKSFGGTRSAIVDALTNSESATAAGNLSNQIRSSGFNAATGLMQGDVNTRNAAAQFAAQMQQGANLANQQAGIQSAGIRSNANSQMEQAARDRDAAVQQRYGTQLSMGMRADDLAQRRADFRYQQFMNDANEGVNDLNLRLAALGMSPYGRTETTNKQSQSESQGPDWATIGLGVLKTIPSLWAMSDREDKTDIKKVGEKYGIPMYSYRYSGDPKTYPKVVGPMAQDIKKVLPHAVKKIGKRMVVHGGVMAGLMEK